MSSISPQPHRTDVAITAGTSFRIEARVTITSGGLLAVGALVSAILLSTAVLVRVAVRQGYEP